MRSYAQHGEDLLLVQHFAGKRGGVFAEVGAYDGVTHSNTYLLERSLGWTGVLVEPIPDNARKCRELRPASTVVEAAAVAPSEVGTISLAILEDFEELSTVALGRRQMTWLADRDLTTEIRHIEVKADTLDHILETAQISALDLLSIDVEGHEAEVFEGLTLSRWNPTVVLVERVRAAIHPRTFKMFWKAGYTYVRTLEINDWWEPADRPGQIIGLFRLAWRTASDLLRTGVRTALRRVGLLKAARRLRERMND